MGLTNYLPSYRLIPWTSVQYSLNLCEMDIRFINNLLYSFEVYFVTRVIYSSIVQELFDRL